MTADANTFYLNQELDREAKEDQQQSLFDYHLSKLVDGEINDALKEHRIKNASEAINSAFIISWDTELLDDDIAVPVPSFYSFATEQTTKNSFLDLYYRLFDDDFKKVLNRFTFKMWKQSMSAVNWHGTKKQFKQILLDYDALKIKDNEMPFKFSTAWLGAFMGNHYDLSIDYNYEDLIMYLLKDSPNTNCYYNYDDYENEAKEL